jgi:hypothetical protein
MFDPCIIAVAITGSVPRKRDNPALPVTVSEQIESIHAAYEAGPRWCMRRRDFVQRPGQVRCVPGWQPPEQAGHTVMLWPLSKADLRLSKRLRA